MNLSTVQVSDFEPLLGETFHIALADQIFELTLIEAHSALARHGNPEARSPFSLLFQGPPAVDFTQGVFPLTHERTGTLDLFLVPIVRDEQSRTVLQAVFS